MNYTKKVKQTRILLLADLDISKEELKNALNLDEGDLLNVLLELCDHELKQYANPFYSEKITINSETMRRLKKYLGDVYKKLDDNNWHVKNRFVVITALKKIQELVNIENKHEDDISYANVIDNLIFDVNNIGIFKIVYNKYKKEFKQHFRDTDNYQILLEKFFDKISDNENEYYLIGIVKILSLIATENSTKHSDIIGLINTYNSKMKSKKTGNKRKEIKKYIGMLKRTVEKQCTNSFEIISTLNLNYGIDREFDFETLNSVRNLFLGTTSDYVDYTNKEIITVDSTPSGCLEDAISFEKNEKGNYLLGLYIIDPTAYLLDNHILEEEAKRRTKAIYLKDGVIPMFPQELSYDLFSLIKGENKKVLAHLYEFSPSFDLIGFESKKALINVKENYGFNDLTEIKNEREEKFITGMQRLKTMLQSEYPEVEKFYKHHYNNKEIIFLDQLVNYIKVFGNHTITKKHIENKVPFLFCVNSNVNEDVNKLQKNNPNIDVQDMINKTKTFYSIENKGHYGLNLDCYAKTTTPVRNFAALKNQDLFKKTVIGNEKYKDIELYLLETELKKIADYMNYKQNMIDAYTEENNYHARKVKRIGSR